MSFERLPELSVVVPVFNEERNVAPLLRELASQREVRLEAIISDGGSEDDSAGAATRLSRGQPFPVRVLAGAKGRARQLNLGAAAARGAWLLFLHIDSSFPDPLSFRKGLDALAAATGSGNAKVAGHFALQFAFDGRPPFPYRFYAAKATLDRPGCTHGDQGFLIQREFFQQLSAFDEKLPFMEDTFLAERVRRQGGWLLLPARIKTSPRRFLSEGLRPRQTLNAILMNLAAVGRLDLIEALKESYQSQHATQRLELGRLLAALAGRIAGLPPGQRRRFWRATASYVRSNAWQIPFFFDLLVGGVSEGKGGKFLAFHDRFIERLIGNWAGDRAAEALVRVWFRLALIACRK